MQKLKCDKYKLLPVGDLRLPKILKNTANHLFSAYYLVLQELRYQKKLRHGSREVRRSKLRYVDAGRRRREKVLFKLLSANGNIVPVTFVNLVCNL
jgi:hypothetical protein